MTLPKAYGISRGWPCAGGQGGPLPLLLPVSTPILFEGNSNTAWAYNAVNYAKQGLAKVGGRFYLPVSGDFANPGAGISTAQYGSNSMQSRQATVVAKIAQMIALAGRCIVFFQIGTNTSPDIAGDIVALTSVVAAYKAAGAQVYCNTCPEFFPVGYISTLNTAIMNGTIGVDGFINVQPVIVTAPAKTHYTDADGAAVSDLFSAFFTPKLTSNSIYTDTFPGFTIDTLSGTGGTVGPNATGTLPTGWTAARALGDGTAAFSISGPDGSGQYTVEMSVTGDASATRFNVTKSQPLVVDTGDVVDGGATVEIVSSTDGTTIQHCAVQVAGGYFPYNIGGFTDPAYWGGTGKVWRVYPINQAGPNTTVPKVVTLYVQAGKTATIRFKGFFHVIRQVSAAVAPVNTVAPVMSAVTVGGTPSCTNGTWTGSPTPTYSQQFYLDATPISSSYVFVTGDIGKAVTCYVTATNSAGSAQQVSNAVLVQAAGAPGTAWDSTNNFLGRLTYFNSNKSAQLNTLGAQLCTRGAVGKTTGKYYFEVQGTGVAMFRAGICDPTVTASNGGVNGTDWCGWVGSLIFYTGGSIGVSAIANNDTICVAVDIGSALFWVRKNNGLWNNSGTADPATNTGGLSCSGLSGGMFPTAATANDTSSVVTLKATATDWLYTAPSGFSVWEAYDTNAQSLFTAMTVQPSVSDKTLINQVFVDLKAQGLYTLLDDFSFPCLADAQSSALRWKTPGTPVTVVGSPTFTAYRGWQLNGSSQYLNTNYNPTSFAGQFAANSASMGTYANVDPGASDSWMIMGGSATSAYIQPRRAGFAGFGYRINNNSSLFPQPMSPNSGIGLAAVTRTSNTAAAAYKNGALLQASVSGSIGLNLNDTIYVGANNNAGTPANYWGGRPAFWFVGGGLDATQNANLYTIVNTFLTAIGAN